MSDPTIYDHVSIFYNDQHEPYLYGVIQVVDGELSSRRFDSPFIISKRREGKPEVVYGTVTQLFEKVMKSFMRLTRFRDQTQAQLQAEGIAPLDGNLLDDSRLSADIIDRQDDLIEEIFVSTCVHVRILAEIFPNRLNQYKIPVYNYEGDHEADITLKSLSNMLQHHRYFVVREQYIIDLVSANEYLIEDRPQMGLKIDFAEYMAKVNEMVHGITVKDLIGVLRGHTKRVSAASSPKDIVFLTQNLYTLGGVVVRNISGPLETVLNNVINKTLNRAQRRARSMSVRVEFTTPRFYLEPDLTDKKIRTEVDVNGIRRQYVLDYKEFFAQIVKGYGNQTLYSE